MGVREVGRVPHEELAKALGAARISLQTGLTASARAGTPISAKYEVEDGQLQLSVYTMKGPKAQSEVMAKAKRSLRAATDQATKENKGYRVVSVVPALKDGHPVAEVTMVRGREFKAVSEKLD